MAALTRQAYDVIKFVAESSGATVEEVEMELTQACLDGGMNHENARALIGLYRVLAIDAGVEGPTLHLRLADDE